MHILTLTVNNGLYQMHMLMYNQSAFVVCKILWCMFQDEMINEKKLPEVNLLCINFMNISIADMMHELDNPIMERICP